MIDFFKGFFSLFRAFGFLRKHNLLWWYALPILLWLILVFGLTFSIAAWLAPIAEKYLAAFFSTPNAQDQGIWSLIKAWISAGLVFSLSWILRILIWVFLGRIAKYVNLIIFSPVLAWFSEKAEALVVGTEYTFSAIQVMKDAWRGVRITLRNLLIELLCMLGSVIALWFMPTFGFVISLLLFLVNSYFMGFSMFDYVLERKKYTLSESVALMRKKKLMVLGLGTAYNFISLFPFLDWVVAPTNGAIGAVLCATSDPEFV